MKRFLAPTALGMLLGASALTPAFAQGTVERMQQPFREMAERQREQRSDQDGERPQRAQPERPARAEAPDRAARPERPQRTEQPAAPPRRTDGDDRPNRGRGDQPPVVRQEAPRQAPPVTGPKAPLPGFPVMPPRTPDRPDRPDRDQPGRDGAGRGGDDGAGRGGYGRDGGQQWNGGGQRPPGYRPPNRGNRDEGRPRYEPRRYPREWQVWQRFDWYGPRYQLPPSFYYRNWSYGEYLPWSWYEPRYYINNWWFYGLPNPPFGAEWVRVGRDAVLVDVFTGRVLTVARYLFW